MGEGWGGEVPLPKPAMPTVRAHARRNGRNAARIIHLETSAGKSFCPAMEKSFTEEWGAAI